MSSPSVVEQCHANDHKDERKKLVDFDPLFGSRQEGELVKE